MHALLHSRAYSLTDYSVAYAVYYSVAYSLTAYSLTDYCRADGARHGRFDIGSHARALCEGACC
jgi:hypothetical protein